MATTTQIKGIYFEEVIGSFDNFSETLFIETYVNSRLAVSL